MKDIGYEIHRIMEANQMVKKKVADKAGITDSELGQIRHRKDMTASKLEKISKALGVSPAYFFDDFEDQTATLTANINNSSVTGDAMVNVGNRGHSVEQLLRIIDHQEKLIDQLMKLNGLEHVVRP